MPHAPCPDILFVCGAHVFSVRLPVCLSLTFDFPPWMFFLFFAAHVFPSQNCLALIYATHMHCIRFLGGSAVRRRLIFLLPRQNKGEFFFTPRSGRFLLRNLFCSVPFCVRN